MSKFGSFVLHPETSNFLVFCITPLLCITSRNRIVPSQPQHHWAFIYGTRSLRLSSSGVRFSDLTQEKWHEKTLVLLRVTLQCLPSHFTTPRFVHMLTAFAVSIATDPCNHPKSKRDHFKCLQLLGTASSLLLQNGSLAGRLNHNQLAVVLLCL